ncbi:molybdopterin-dependent oxidoreductase [Amycolatopsis regifaucium]|uniref:Molybdopterin-binding oxidoreductase n=1 Tax=Amycolatopsis regifaucium TaxID=546365 RepID=A0A154MNT0_9PSEU|nr:molybdopterin-dependent oxidoreductase [Amycolatopsis regifaucium]KZB85079.1 molybdopterin-binding oxidoreductase [Amycolatopsis regifaucium]OKA04104.1 molybdopterin-binding oxidoreductase [Amycolatopsis regifaucium]SFH94639.1 Anaerobic selenocysteine-containing dehydrogenase [Amycolatopsis regifaucium]
MTTAHVTCPLCEATCGLEVTIDEKSLVTRVQGDREDVFSHGYICPKGASLGALHHDPDRLTAPLVKRDGEFVEVTWDEAFAEIDKRLRPIIEEHGKDAVAVYSGNPTVHNAALVLYGRVFFKALGTKNFYTATTVDQMPKHFSSGYLFGDPQTIPVADLDRTEHLIVLGANPLVSNGSLMTAADIRGRLRGIQRRGGKIVVLDPRRTRTAQLADEHHAIRPGTDALFLFALVNVLFAENRVSPSEHVNGVDEVRALAEPFTPEAVAPATGIDAAEIRRIALELADAGRAAVYGRMGTTTQSYGTIASWLVDVVNTLTGNLDREGGMMFPLPALWRPRRSSPFTSGRWKSRVRGYPEVLGELPVATLADEIETPGAGQVRALVTISGNPALSTPNSARLTEALRQLDFMVSLDVYLNETTRHADVILPGPSPLERPHYDVALYALAVRNVANWTPQPLETDMPQEWVTLLRMAGIAAGQGPDVDVTAFDTMVAAETARRTGVDLALAEGRTGPARMIDLMLRGGPYRLTLADLEAAPHGIDLGALKPRLPEALATASGKVELAPDAITKDVPRLRAELDKAPDDGLLLIGRRHLSSNNSWMHNLTPLVRGGNRCTVQVHPDDASRLGLTDGGLASVTSRSGKLEAPVEVTPDVRPGVVSMPHGWGHDLGGTRTAVASAHAGVNSNLVADETLLDVPSGTAVLNGIPVDVAPV